VSLPKRTIEEEDASYWYGAMKLLLITGV
jgi:hypothetical protein